MKITTLQAFLFCRHRFRNPLHLRFWVGERILWKRDTMLIRVGTDLRLVGYAPGPASEKVAQLINRNLRSALVNADPTKIEALRKKILQRRPQFPGIYEAYGALEIALPDLKGKAEGSPVFELISLRTRDRISLTQALEFRSVPKSAEEEAHRVVELGLAGSKVQAGSGPDRELEVVREVRSVLPSQTSLMVDGNAWWCLGEHKYTHPEIDQFGSGALAFENWGTPLDGVAMAHFGICFNEKTIKWLEWPCLSDGGYLKSHFSTLAKKF